MEGKIKISEEEVKAMVRQSVKSMLPFRCRITDISTRYSYSLDVEVDYTDEIEEVPEPYEKVADLFHDDPPDEAA